MVRWLIDKFAKESAVLRRNAYVHGVRDCLVDCLASDTLGEAIEKLEARLKQAEEGG